jgi:poly(3-hydroxybutyrate) depolymerase
MRGRQLTWFAGSIVMLIGLATPRPISSQSRDLPELVRRTLSFRGMPREYFLHLPSGFDGAKSYWGLVVVHGAGEDGRTPFPNRAMARFTTELGLEAIVISPSFSNDDYNASRFPSLGEGEFLDAVLKEVRSGYTIRPRIFLTGYSRGGQFSHRYALAHPDRVAAVAPIASGTWTTPDGRFLVEGLGELSDVRAFLADPANAARVPENLRDLFQARVAAAARRMNTAGGCDRPLVRAATKGRRKWQTIVDAPLPTPTIWPTGPVAAT